MTSNSISWLLYRDFPYSNEFFDLPISQAWKNNPMIKDSRGLGRTLKRHNLMHEYTLAGQSSIVQCWNEEQGHKEVERYVPSVLVAPSATECWFVISNIVAIILKPWILCPLVPKKWVFATVFKNYMITDDTKTVSGIGWNMNEKSTWCECMSKKQLSDQRKLRRWTNIILADTCVPVVDNDVKPKLAQADFAVNPALTDSSTLKIGSSPGHPVLALYVHLPTVTDTLLKTMETYCKNQESALMQKEMSSGIKTPPQTYLILFHLQRSWGSWSSKDISSIVLKQMAKLKMTHQTVNTDHEYILKLKRHWSPPYSKQWISLNYLLVHSSKLL